MLQNNAKTNQRLFPGKTTLKLVKYPEIKKLITLVMLQLIALQSWLLGCFGFNSSLKKSVYIDRGRKKRRKNKRKD